MLRQISGVQPETVVRSDGIKAYSNYRSEQPIDSAGVRGVATLQGNGDAKRYRYGLFPGGDGSLSVPADSPKVSGRQVASDYDSVGNDAAGKSVAYRDVATVAGEITDQSSSGKTSDNRQVRPAVYHVTAADQPYIKAQKMCPVMDMPLKAMGGPYRVNADGRIVYSCCPGCAKKIAADPA